MFTTIQSRLSGQTGTKGNPEIQNPDNQRNMSNKETGN